MRSGYSAVLPCSSLWFSPWWRHCFSPETDRGRAHPRRQHRRALQSTHLTLRARTIAGPSGLSLRIRRAQPGDRSMTPSPPSSVRAGVTETRQLRSLIGPQSSVLDTSQLRGQCGPPQIKRWRSQKHTSPSHARALRAVDRLLAAYADRSPIMLRRTTIPALVAEQHIREHRMDLRSNRPTARPQRVSHSSFQRTADQGRDYSRMSPESATIPSGKLDFMRGLDCPWFAIHRRIPTLW